jgi:hypothetical protein
MVEIKGHIQKENYGLVMDSDNNVVLTVHTRVENTVIAFSTVFNPQQLEELRTDLYRIQGK